MVVERTIVSRDAAWASVLARRWPCGNVTTGRDGTRGFVECVVLDVAVLAGLFPATAASSAGSWSG